MASSSDDSGVSDAELFEFDSDITAMLSAQSGPRLPATSSAGAGDNGVNTVHAPVNITKSTEAHAGGSLPHFEGSSGTVSSCSNSDAEQVPVAAAFHPSTSSFAAAVPSSSSAMRVHVRFADDDDSVTVEKTDVSSEASLDVAAYEAGLVRAGTQLTVQCAAIGKRARRR